MKHTLKNVGVIGIRYPHHEADLIRSREEDESGQKIHFICHDKSYLNVLFNERKVHLAHGNNSVILTVTVFV
jgi:hypothetical protein